MPLKSLHDFIENVTKLNEDHDLGLHRCRTLASSGRSRRRGCSALGIHEMLQYDAGQHIHFRVRRESDCCLFLAHLHEALVVIVLEKLIAEDAILRFIALQQRLPEFNERLVAEGRAVLNL